MISPTLWKLCRLTNLRPLDNFAAGFGSPLASNRDRAKPLLKIPGEKGATATHDGIPSSVNGKNEERGRFTLEKLCRLCRKHRRGAAVVEFAVVAPVFFLLVFGMIEYGRMVMVQQVITNASREGARIGVLDGSTTSGVTSAVQTYLNAASIRNAIVTVSPSPPSSAGYGAPVTVTVAVGFNQVSWLPSPMFLRGRTLTATTVMRRETIQ